MSVLESEIIISIGNANIKHYRELGYEIDKNKATSILVKVVDLPKGSRVRVTKVCDEDGCYQKTPNITYASVLRGRWDDGKDRCRKCGNLYMRKLQRNNLPYEKSLKFFAINNGLHYLLLEFSDKNNTTPDKIFKMSNRNYYWNCHICESEFVQSVNNRTSNYCKCPYCAGQKVNHTNNLGNTHPKLAKEWHPYKNDKLTTDDVHFSSNKYAWWQCAECNHEWASRIETRTNRGYGCPQCNESKGEKRIRKWLEENKIIFVPQKEYEGLIGLGGGNLSYDFYLSKQNTLIEYQGQFHDGKENEYVRRNIEYQQEHDKRKKDYASLNNIKLLEIWYWDYDSIEEILSKEVKF